MYLYGKILNKWSKRKFERGKGNLKKKKEDSWVDEVKIDGNEFIGRKTMDYSMFNHGTFLPIRYQDKFLVNLSNRLVLGGNVSINLILDEVTYVAKIDMPNSTGKTFIFW